MLNTGELDRKISIERKVVVQDVSGEEIPTWERIGKRTWARLRNLGGSERYTAEQVIARQQVEFLVRWKSELASVSPMDRVVYPINSTPMDCQIYDIMAVEEVGWKEGLKLVAARRSET